MIENKTFGNLYKFLYSRMPKNYKKFCIDYFRYADITMPEEVYFGFLMVYGIVLSLCIFFIVDVTRLVSRMTTALIASCVFIMFEILFHYVVVMIAEKRASVTEEILPDALKLMASNIRSGLTPDKALMLSARPEFGPLETQIVKAAKRNLSGESMQEALKIIPENINSKILKDTVDLISEGIKKGGDLSNLLDGIAEDISRTRILRKEISAQVMMYSIFIFFATAIGGPVLYSISSQLVRAMTSIGKNIKTPSIQTGFLSFNPSGLNVDKNFILRYSILSIMITSIFGGILMGILKGESEKEGIKYIPIVLGVSLFVYFISKLLVEKFLGGILV